jgi:hypothetical protein
MVGNTLSNRRFKIKPHPKGTAWEDIKPNFGVIKGLHLEFLEFAHKIKKNAPLIPEPQYSGKALDEPKDTTPPPPPASSSKTVNNDNLPKPSPRHSVEKSTLKSSSSSSSTSEDEYDEATDHKDFMDKFGVTPDKQSKKQEKVPKYIHVKDDDKSSPKQQDIISPPKVITTDEQEKEEDPTEVYIREEVERRTNIAALKKAKLAGIDVGEIEDEMDLQTTRILRKTVDSQISHSKSISMNRFALMGIFFSADQGLGLMTDKMKGYFQYQMDIMHVYDDYLEAIGESSLTTYLQQLDPTVQLFGMICLTTGGFFIFQNFVGEDKVKGAKLIKSFFPGQAQVIDDITNASKKVKEDKKVDEPEKPVKKRRGPSYKAEDINKAE